MNGKEYAISEVSLPWFEALEHCEAANATLVVIETPEEQDYLSQFARPSLAYVFFQFNIA